MAVARQVNESPLMQGVDEQIAYQITTTPWGSSPSAVTVTAFDVTTTRTDVSTTVLSGAATVLRDVITTPVVKSLTVKHLYRIEVKFTCASNIFETWFILEAEY